MDAVATKLSRRIDMNRHEDLISRRFGRLTVIEYGGVRVTPCGAKRHMWRCLCDCGKEKIVEAGHLKNGHTKSCGCLHNEILGKSKYKHGGKGTRLYDVWQRGE